MRQPIKNPWFPPSQPLNIPAHSMRQPIKNHGSPHAQPINIPPPSMRQPIKDHGEPEGRKPESHTNARLCRLLPKGRKNSDAGRLAPVVSYVRPI